MTPALLNYVVAGLMKTELQNGLVLCKNVRNFLPIGKQIVKEFPQNPIIGFSEDHLTRIGGRRNFDILFYSNQSISTLFHYAYSLVVFS